MENNWEEPYDEDGVTLGPEEALLRETEKTKALKVEKLQLKDTIEKLKTKNDVLTKTNHSLEEKLRSLAEQPMSNIDLKADHPHTPLEFKQTRAMRWSYFLLIFNLTALTILITFHLKQ